MATTTPNFGWPVPTSTDLVKDGAVAIEGLGDAIDASLLDLKGGTTGQVLAKATNTDMDFTWVAQDDSNAIQNAIVDAKGDLIAATANDTPARLAVGTNGQVLTADSTAATGLKWATVSSTPTAAGCLVVNTASQSVANATDTILTFNDEYFDTNGFHSTVTNTSRLTIPAGYAGGYLVYGKVTWASNSTGLRYFYPKINGGGTTAGKGAFVSGSTGQNTMVFSFYQTFAVADYIEMVVYQSSGGALGTDGTYYSNFGLAYLGA